MSHVLTLPIPSYERRITIDRGSQGGWWVLTHYSHVRFATAREAIAYVRPLVAQGKLRAGRAAVEPVWESLCEQQARAARERCTVRELLRRGRAEVRDLIDRHRRCSPAADALATRQVIQQARDILLERDRRRADRAVAEQARAGQPGRIAALVPQYRARREAKRREGMLGRLRAGRLGRAAFEQLLPELLEKVSGDADAAVRQAVLLVGAIGEQCASDLERMRTDQTFAGKQGRHHKLQRTTLHRVEHVPDWSAALITLRDYTSFGSSRWGGGDRHYGTRGGSSYRCYLVVRDPSTGEAHILRVPPKFGNADTQFFRALREPAARVKHAVAWTFGRTPAEYAPAVEA